MNFVCMNGFKVLSSKRYFMHFPAKAIDFFLFFVHIFVWLTIRRPVVSDLKTNFVLPFLIQEITT